MGKLTANTLEYVSFYIPKRVEGFHAEMYPDCLTGEVNSTVEEWKSGSNKEPARKQINTLENKWKTSESTFDAKELIVSEQQVNVSTVDNSREIQHLRERNQELEHEVLDLKNQIANLMQKVT